MFRFNHALPINLVKLIMLLCLSPVCLLIGCGKSVRADNAAPKMVFAHYMITYTPGSAGFHVTAEDYKKEIVYAQAHDIDGFVLDCADWQAHAPYYKARTMEMYQAARELGTGFKLMISADFCCGISIDDVRDMVASTYNEPAQFKLNGVPVLSTFGSFKRLGDMGDLVSSLKVQGTPIVLVPNIQANHMDPSGPVTVDEVHQLMSDYPFMDGDFYFGAGNDPQTISDNIKTYAEGLVPNGKIFIAGVAPFYRNRGRQFRVYETKGFRGMQMEWITAIKSNATWVEIVTWNDWAESTYVSPFETANVNRTTGRLVSHEAYLNASRYYIDWFKNGAPPEITQDRLYYFYRLHPKSVAGVIDPSGKTFPGQTGFPQGVEALNDNVYVTVFLTAPADLTINSGSQSQTFHLNAGVQDVDMPFAPGGQRFILVRNNQTVLDMTGENPISPSDNSSNFNYFSGGTDSGNWQ